MFPRIVRINWFVELAFSLRPSDTPADRLANTAYSLSLFRMHLIWKCLGAKFFKETWSIEPFIADNLLFVFSRSENDLITNSISNQLAVIWWVISWIESVHKVNQENMYPKHLSAAFHSCISLDFICFSSLFMLFSQAKHSSKVNGAEKYKYGSTDVYETKWKEKKN